MAELFISRPELTPPLLGRCSGGGGDEHWHCKHRYGVWSKYGRWIFLQSFRYLGMFYLLISKLARLSFDHLFWSGLLITVQREPTWGHFFLSIFPQHITSFHLPRLRICCSGVLLHLNSKHTLTGALGRSPHRATVCVWCVEWECWCVG